MTTESDGEHHCRWGVFAGPSRFLIMLTLGMTKDKIYFPVHKGFGLRIAGMGICFSCMSEPSHIIRFITVGLSIKLSLLVKSIMPNNES